METTESNTATIRRRPGPKPKGITQQYAVMLEPEPAEWAKEKPGGLSDFIRRLLREAYEADQSQARRGGERAGR